MSEQSQNMLFDLVQVKILHSDGPIDEDSLDALINQFRPLVSGITDEEADIVRKRLQAKFFVNMDKGQLLKEKNHESWYQNAKKDSKTHFWDRYREYLLNDNGFSPSVVRTLSANAETVVDLLGDSRLPIGFSRKGLVIGDVQSGKTSTYLAIINKAADVQYKVFIILTGTIEKLRQQTQQRVDSGFLGSESNQPQQNCRIGVGNYYDRFVEDEEFQEMYESPWSFTSVSSDFSNPGTTGRLSVFSSPVVFVVKKNSNVLNRLLGWLSKNNAGQGGGINIPMLLIDDEADNASINTKKDPDEATAINAAIRKLLKLFTKSNYVGFTATPYANIFINPDTDTDMLAADLFPSDFIYQLKAPDNYIGPKDIFKGEGDIDDDGDKIEYGRCHFMLKDNEDVNGYLAVGHKNNALVGSDLPTSLKEAIMSFFIANTILDLRKQGPLHRTMMINVTRFRSVQEDLKDVVNSYVAEVKKGIRLYSHRNDVTKPELDLLERIYKKHFEILNNEGMFTWNEVRNRLHESVNRIEVRTVNSGNSSKSLNYDDYKEDGLRLIVIGGDCLSRGLTLHGLMVSYYNRNSKMYDTLMQMGRWFGYRTGYEDLCQIWMTETARKWYSYIWSATAELKKDIDLMNAEGKTPKDFGLRVRSDEAALMVTAANKRRSSRSISMLMSYSGKVVETPYLYVDEKISKQNYDHVTGWLDKLLQNHSWIKDTSNVASNLRYQIKNISYEEVLALLKGYNSHYLNFNFDTSIIENWVDRVSEDFPCWDLVIASGSGIEKNLGNLRVSPVLRKYKIKGDEVPAYQMSGEKAHLGSKRVYLAGLTKAEYNQIKKEILKDDLSQDDYFRSSIKRNPLLVIWPVSLKGEAGEEKTELSPLIGLSVGCPRISNERSEKVTYTINLTKQRQLLEAQTGDDDKDDDIDD